jgi:hypothetical protein
MATIEKRTTDEGTRYRVKIRLKGFTPETATFERLTDARAWAAKTEANMKAGRHFGESKRHTFNDLIKEYSAQAKPLLKSWDHREMHLAYWLKAFGDCQLDTITPARIAKERDNLLSGETYRHTKRTGATVVRYLAALSACMAHGVRELQWLERNPVERIKKPAEPAHHKRRDRLHANRWSRLLSRSVQLGGVVEPRLHPVCAPVPRLQLLAGLSRLQWTRHPSNALSRPSNAAASLIADVVSPPCSSTA